MTITRPSSGFTANWMLQPPVSTPTARMMPIERSRRCWYSRSVSVIAGATVIESPVCTPIGSRFSIEQTITTLSACVAHDLELVLLPADDRLLEEHLGGRAGGEPGAGDPPQVGLVVGHAGAGAAHGERRPDDHRVAELLRRRQAVLERVADDDCGRPRHRAPRRSRLNDSRFSPRSIASMEAPISSTPYFSSTPVSSQRHRRVQRGLAAEGGEQRVGALLLDDLLDELRGDRLDVGRVGELRVGHDRGRVGVDQDDPEALGLQHPAGLGAGVVELAGLADDDRPGADHQDALDVVALRHQALAFARS